MTIQIYKALWGMTGIIEQQFEQIAEAGVYDGIEVWPQFHVKDKARFCDLVEDYGFKLIIAGMIPAKETLKSELTELASYNPVKINLQSGRDDMTFDEGCVYIETALAVEAEIGVSVLHETHRGKMLFTPWVTLAYLNQFPELRITADYSHWVNVCERLPDDQQAALDLANARAHHIHGRVGYEEGPQVPDPSAPEYAPQLEWHEKQWLQIYKHQIEAASMFTFTPEYGPPLYLHTLPHTQAPVASLWEVCLWGAKRARELFAQLG